MRMYPYMAPDVYCSQCFWCLFDVNSEVEKVLKEPEFGWVKPYLFYTSWKAPVGGKAATCPCQSQGRFHLSHNINRLFGVGEGWESLIFEWGLCFSLRAASGEQEQVKVLICQLYDVYISESIEWGSSVLYDCISFHWACLSLVIDCHWVLALLCSECFSLLNVLPQLWRYNAMYTF